MYHRKTDVSASKVRANHELRTRCHEVVSAAIAPKRIPRQEELWPQFVIRGNLAATAESVVPLKEVDPTGMTVP